MLPDTEGGRNAAGVDTIFVLLSALCCCDVTNVNLPEGVRICGIALVFFGTFFIQAH